AEAAASLQRRREGILDLRPAEEVSETLVVVEKPVKFPQHDRMGDPIVSLEDGSPSRDYNPLSHRRTYYTPIPVSRFYLLPFWLTICFASAGNGVSPSPSYSRTRQETIPCESPARTTRLPRRSPSSDGT